MTASVTWRPLDPGEVPQILRSSATHVLFPVPCVAAAAWWRGVRLEVLADAKGYVELLKLGRRVFGGSEVGLRDDLVANCQAEIEEVGGYEGLIRSIRPDEWKRVGRRGGDGCTTDPPSPGEEPGNASASGRAVDRWSNGPGRRGEIVVRSGHD